MYIPDECLDRSLPCYIETQLIVIRILNFEVERRLDGPKVFLIQTCINVKCMAAKKTST